MKRQIGPRGVVADAKQCIDDSEGHERKRSRMSFQVKESINLQNRMEENIEASVDDIENSDTTPYTVQFYEVQTSTPIVQNGTVKIAAQLTDEVPSTSMSIIEQSSDNPINTNSDQITTSSNTNEQTNGIKSSSDTEDDDENVNILKILPSTEKANMEKFIDVEHDNEHYEAIETNSSEDKIVNGQENHHEIPQEEKQISQTNISWHYDCSTFLNSFLNVSHLEGHADNVNAVVADGDLILSASCDTTIKLWDHTTKKEVRNFQGHTSRVTSLILLTLKESISLATKMNFPDDSRILISASLDCSVRFWALSSGTQLSTFYTYNGITCIAYLDESHQIVVGTDGGKLELWDVLTSKAKYSILAHGEKITSLKVNGGYVYTTSTDGLVKVWYLEDDECNAVYIRRRMQRSRSHVSLEPTQWQCLDVSNDIIYLGDNTSDLKLLNWKDGHIDMVSNRIQPADITGAVYIKENILLCSYFDFISDFGGINVWQLPEMKYVCTLYGNVKRITSVDMTITEDKILRVVSGGMELCVWDFILDKLPSEEENATYFCRNIEILDIKADERCYGDSSGSSVSLTVAKEENPKSKPWCTIM